MMGASAAAAPRQTTVPTRSASARVVAGVLTAPSAVSREQIARDFVAARSGASFRLLADRSLAGCTLITLGATHRGLEVVGSTTSVRLDALGRVRWARMGGPAIAADLDIMPSIDARAALSAAFGAAADGIDETRHARLVVLAHPALDVPRLAWHVALSDAHAPAAWRVYVDAVDGHVLTREPLGKRAQKHRANVFELNPVADEGQTVEVAFEDLRAWATTLEDDELRVVNCIDERKCHSLRTAAGIRNVHFCELVPTAVAGPDGDFLHIEPGGDTDPQDAFAELQAYHHVKTALDAFRTFADDPYFALRNQLTTVVNMRAPDLSSDVSACDSDTAPLASRLHVEDNAYFWPAGEVGPVELGDRLVLSQGERADWAYDGEVVYHEVTHAVMNTTTSLGWMLLDERGLDPSPGGLHEGFSDYFAATISDNPDLSWYAGTTEDGPAPMGSLLDVHRCTDILVGEEHDESKPWAEALWAIRRSLRSGAKRAMFDRALFRVISALGQYDGFAEAHDLVLAELDVAAEELINSEGMDSSEAAALRDIVAKAPNKFADRDVPECGDRVMAIEPGDVKAELYAKGPTTWSSPVAPTQLLPSSMQFALEVPQHTAAIRLVIDYTYALDDEMKPPGAVVTPGLMLLVGGDSPITWTWSLPHGDHDAAIVEPVAVDDDENGAAVATVHGDFAAGTYYVQIANAGADWGLGDLHFEIADEDGEFGDGKADGGDTDTAGSGCSAGGGAGGTAGASIALFVLVVVCRRRR